MKLIKSLFVALIITSCKPAYYQGSYGQANQTQVILNNANFKVLGSFSGTVTSKKNKISIKNEKGLIANAKSKFLENARLAGIELTGSRTLTNVSVDIIENNNKITSTFSAEIIEFIK